MYKITQTQKVLWELYCEFSWIPEDVWFTEHPKYDYVWNEDGSFKELKTVGSYREKHTRISSKQWDFLHSAYHKCTQVLGIVTESFQQFANRFLNGFSNPYKYKAKWDSRRYYGWWKRRENPTKYRHQFYHEKKELNEKQLAKKEWREKKFVKDKRKSYWYKGRKTYYKRLSNKNHRRWSKQEIKLQNYDLWDKEYKFFADPWDWY